jgi:hypothetical protein
MQRGSKAPSTAKRSSLAGAQVNTHTQLHPQVMPPCNYAAKTVRMLNHHCKFYPAGVNFDELTVGQNWQGVLSLVPLRYCIYLFSFSLVPSLVPYSVPSLVPLSIL